MENYEESLSQILLKLRKEGYTDDLNLQLDRLEAKSKNLKVFHDEFHVDKVYRFEGPTDPADESVIYAISSKKNNLKGVLVNGYGIYSEPATNEILRKLEL